MYSKRPVLLVRILQSYKVLESLRNDDVFNGRIEISLFNYKITSSRLIIKNQKIDKDLIYRVLISFPILFYSVRKEQAWRACLIGFASFVSAKLIRLLVHVIFVYVNYKNFYLPVGNLSRTFIGG